MTDFPSSPSHSATITDVVREAGTSKISVSRYLSGGTQVFSENLRQRIEVVIQWLNYQPNQVARGLKRGHNRLLGMLAADLINPYTIKVLQGVRVTCHMLDYIPFICHTANEIEVEYRPVQLLTTYQVGGLIANTLGVEGVVLRPLRSNGIPAVLVDRTIEGLDVDLVESDNCGAVSSGVQRLLGQGFDVTQFIV